MPQAQVIVYSKPGCHLCDEAKASILAAGCDDLFTFQEINIETDPALFERYKNDIPVVTINGIEAFRHRVNRQEFAKRLKPPQE